MNDVIEFQRLASGYIPGLSEAGSPAAGAQFGASGPLPSSTSLQNCIAFRPAATAVGVYDILVGGAGPFPVGLGGPLASAFPNPPLVVVPVSPAGQIVQQGRVRLCSRAHINAAVPPVVGGAQLVIGSVLYGATLGPVPVYPGFSNAQLIRIYFATAAGVLADADFDFEIQRVLDPSQEP